MRLRRVGVAQVIVASLAAGVSGIVAIPDAVGAATAHLKGVTSIVSDTGNMTCAIVASGGVDCWGAGDKGQLGDDTRDSSATPVQVVGVGGTGTLSGVASLTGSRSSVCALLTSGGVDCWGRGRGQLGNGAFKGHDKPVQVVGVGGTGILSGVASLTGNGAGTFCALFTSGGVDCWGNGSWGALGNGTMGTDGMGTSSATPVQVVGVGGTGTLTGVASLTGSDLTFCATLTSGGVDCWGNGEAGQLGNGTFYIPGNYGSATPVQVVGVGGTGTLSGVSSLASDGETICALLTSGTVDCWGFGRYGQLGTGTFYTSANNYGSATPVQVVGVGGTGTLSGVSSLATLPTNSGSSTTVCVLLTSDGVDCWGGGEQGQLGNGTFYTSGNEGSATPVQVVGVGGTGTLSGVSSLASSAYAAGTFCALLTSSTVDCWGLGKSGQLGNGTFYTSANNYGSATPVQVVSVGGTGTLSGVASVTGDSIYWCALLASGRVDCWGDGYFGQLGNGTFYTSGNPGSARPVRVLSAT